MTTDDGTHDARCARVMAVVAAGRRIADPTDTLGREARAGLAHTSGLTREGVELALTQHLEKSVSAGDLERMLARVGLAPRCHVVLASNVCTAPLRCLAVAVATASCVFVRPSRRDPVLATLLVRALCDEGSLARAGGRVQIVDEILPSAADEVHLYGSDASLTTLAARLSPNVVVRAHGTGLGIALVGRQDDAASAAGSIAHDIIAFDQRGCLSPRVVLVDAPTDGVLAVARALHLELERASVPRGRLDEDTLGQIALYRASAQAIGQVFSGQAHVVGVDLAPRGLALPPAGRVAHVIRADATTARTLLTPWAPYVTAIGADDAEALSTAVVALTPQARRSRLGLMQRPPLDGPVDLRRCGARVAGT